MILINLLTYCSKKNIFSNLNISTKFWENNPLKVISKAYFVPCHWIGKTFFLFGIVYCSSELHQQTSNEDQLDSSEPEMYIMNIQKLGHNMCSHGIRIRNISAEIISLMIDQYIQLQDRTTHNQRNETFTIKQTSLSQNHQFNFLAASNTF